MVCYKVGRSRILTSGRLTGIKLDNELFANGNVVEIFPGRHVKELGRHFIVVVLDPSFAASAAFLEGKRVLDELQLPGFFLQRDNVARFHMVAGHVDLLAVYQDMFVSDELAGLGPGAWGTCWPST